MAFIVLVGDFNKAALHARAAVDPAVADGKLRVSWKLPHAFDPPNGKRFPTLHGYG